jgi:hypothetical protein
VQRNKRRRTILRLFLTVLESVSEINPGQRRAWLYQSGSGCERICDQALRTVVLVDQGLACRELPLPRNFGVEQIAQAVAEKVAAEYG